MPISILIATFFSVGFFVESVIGTGGGLLAYSFLGFFSDIKEMILAGLFIGTCSSSYIIYTDHKSFNKELFINTIPYCFFGTIIGVLIFSKFDVRILGGILGVLLIIISLKTIFFHKANLPKFLKNKLLFIGGFSHGAFGIGGPFVTNALRDDFKNKSDLRTTMAVYFVTFNFLRIIQLGIQGQLHWNFFNKIWWTMIPVFIAIKIGYKVHLKISETLLKKIIAFIAFLAGIKFLLEYALS